MSMLPPPDFTTAMADFCRRYPEVRDYSKGVEAAAEDSLTGLKYVGENENGATVVRRFEMVAIIIGVGPFETTQEAWDEFQKELKAAPAADLVHIRRRPSLWLDRSFEYDRDEVFIRCRITLFKRVA